MFSRNVLVKVLICHLPEHELPPSEGLWGGPPRSLGMGGLGGPWRVSWVCLGGLQELRGSSRDSLGALRATFWGLLMIFLILLVWGILAVHEELLRQSTLHCKYILHRCKRTLNSLGLNEESRYKWGLRARAGYRFRIWAFIYKQGLLASGPRGWVHELGPSTDFGPGL